MNPPHHPTFALIGAAGFVAPRHMQAIKDVEVMIDVFILTLEKETSL